MKRLLVICGPTATGKTALALKLAGELNGELVSADSRQVYRSMDIGTGKDLPTKLSSISYRLSVKFRNKKYDLTAYNYYGIPLWMYDVVNPDELFSVSHYFHLASGVIDDIHKRGKLPVVVGGTGLYIKSLVSPPETIDIPQNIKLRKELSLLTIKQLQDRISHSFPGTWDMLNSSDRANPRRLIRKIEIGQFQAGNLLPAENSGNSRYDPYIIGLTADLPVLYRAIDMRVDMRVKQGIVQEISGLLQAGYSWNLEALNTPGYKEWQPWFDGGSVRTPELRMKCIQAWKYDEHAYARRQLIWFRKEKGINWYSITGSGWEEKVRNGVYTWYTSR